MLLPGAFQLFEVTWAGKSGGLYPTERSICTGVQELLWRWRSQPPSKLAGLLQLPLLSMQVCTHEDQFRALNFGSAWVCSLEDLLFLHWLLRHQWWVPWLAQESKLDICEYTSPGFLWIAGRHDCPAPWTLPKASHRGDSWPRKGLWVGCSVLSRRGRISTFFSECSTCYCVLLVMDITQNSWAPKIVSRAKQSWEFCCLLPQDKCHDHFICNIKVLRTRRKVSASLS